MLRFSNIEVLKNIEGVVEEILKIIRKEINQTNPLNPPFSKGTMNSSPLKRDNNFLPL